MKEGQGQKDLYVLVADLDLQKTMEGLLNRVESLGIRPIKYTIDRHLNHDSGCRTNSSQFLRPHIGKYQYALVVFDRDGCGHEQAHGEEIQHAVERELAANGWADRSKAIVIDPELETWVWNGSNRVPQILGWEAEYQELKAWLVDEALWPSNCTKPPDPKKAYRAALRKVKRRVSSAIFGELAKSVKLHNCQDSAFNELRDTLQRWFPAVHP